MTSAPAGASLLTGATGFIGAEILRRLLAEPDRRVYVLVRAPDERAAELRGRDVLFKLFLGDLDATAAVRNRVHWIPGDLIHQNLGLSMAAREEICSECDEVIHAAASTDWDLPFEQANAVNYAGLVALADVVAELGRGGRQARLVHISTAYVAGPREGRIHPDDLSEAGSRFNNTYEETKAKAERYLRQRMGELPVTVVRPSIVVGDSRTGRTFNFNVLYFPIKLLHRGLLPIVPGRPTTRLDIVPVDYVCDATLALGRDPTAVGRTYHLTADDDAILLPVFSAAVARCLSERRPPGSPPIRPPRLVGPVVWGAVRRWVGWRLTGRPKEQFQAFNLYLPYILANQQFDASATRQALAGTVAYPRIETYIRAMVEYAVTREWGRDVSWESPGDTPEA